ncbi:MAG: rRNA pseudouridine synthase [Cytophagales bacterium]|nr:rRNA pseudouridine synthase [Cytophagales bacterium]
MAKKKEGDGFGKTKTGNRRTPRAWDNPIPSYKRKASSERRDEKPFGKAKTEGRDFDKRPGDDRRSDDKPFRRSFRRDDNTERRGFRRDDRDSGPEKRGFRRDDRTGDSDRKSSFRRRDDNDRPFEKKSFDKRGEKPFRRDERSDRGDRPFNRRDDRNDDRRDFRRDERPSDDRRRSERPFDPEKRPSRNRLSGPEERPFRKSYRRDDDRSDDRRGSDRRGGFAKRSDDKPVGGYRKRRDDVSFDEVRPGDKRRSDSSEKRPFGRDKRDDRNERPFGRRSNDRRDDRRDDKRGTPPSYDLKSYEQKERGRGRGKTKETDPENEEVRLNRYIANAGICSRREADVLIESGEIKVNGKVVTEMGFKVKPGDIVQYGKRTLSREKMVYVMLNKPKDYITTTDDPEERNTVMDLIGDACQERIYPVGRLDRNTTGLLLLTNDGELAEKLAHPSNEIQKLYEVELDKPITPEDYQAIIDGVELEDGLAKVDDLAIVSPDRKFIGIALHLGRNRIVRRIFEHLGYKVVKLDRTVYAGITKKDLPRGRWRYLTEREVIRLKYFV